MPLHFPACEQILHVSSLHKAGVREEPQLEKQVEDHENYNFIRH